MHLSDGGGAARARARTVDEALGALLAEEVPAARLAVVAVGGYGRGTLSPHSDVDIWLVAERGGVGREVVRALLYPLWDAGFHVGHASGTPKDLVERATSDVHAATSLVHARFVTGNSTNFDDLVDRRARWLRRYSKQLVRGDRPHVAEGVEEGSAAVSVELVLQGAQLLSAGDDGLAEHLVAVLDVEQEAPESEGLDFIGAWSSSTSRKKPGC